MCPNANTSFAVFSGEGQWRCPRCQEYVKLLDDQDVDTENEISQLQVWCPNKKYGCPHVDQLKNIPKHVKECENTLEAALPMEYKGTNTLNLLYERVSELTQQLKELSQVVRTLKSDCDNNWMQTQTRLSDVENKVGILVRQFAKEIDGFKSDLCTQTERLTSSEIQFKEGVTEMKTTLELVREEVEKMKSDQIGLSAKADEVETFFQRMEQKADDYKDQMDDFKSRIVSMEANMTSVAQLDNKIFEFSRDLQQQEEHRKEAEEKQQQKFDALKVEISHQNTTELITALTTTMNDNIMALLKKEMKEMEQRTFQQMEKIVETIDKINIDLINIAKHQKDDKKSQEENRKMMEKMVIQIKRDVIQFQNEEIQPQFFQELMAMYEVYEWAIDGSELRLCTSEVFSIPGYHLDAQVQLRNDGNSFICTSLQFIETGRQRPDIKLMPKVAYILVDQSSKGTKADIIRTGLYSFGQLFEYGKDMFKEGFEDKLVNSSIYLKNNCIKIKILVEFQSIADSFTSNNGFLLWKVDNYAKRVMEKDDIVWYQESPYFYTSPQGYRVQLRLYIRHTHFTARLIFLTGEFDSSLTKQFPFKLTITIVNQEDSGKNAVIAKACDKADNTEISDASSDISSYVKNDSLLLRAVVEPI